MGATPPVGGGAPAEGVAPASSEIPASADAGTSSAAPEPSDWGDSEWEEWDGTPDGLPEHLRGPGKRIQERVDSSYASQRAHFQEITDVYNAIIREHEDPRIQKMTKEQAALKSEYEAYKAEHGGYKDQLGKLREEYEGFQQMSAREYADRFWDKHATIKDDPKLVSKFSELIRENGPHGGEWDAYVAAELLELDEGALAEAIEAKKDGASDKYALRIAKLSAEKRSLEGKLSEREQATQDRTAQQAAMEAEMQRARAPRVGATITNGATKNTQPEVRQPSISDATSLEEARTFAARRALRVHSGGK